MVGRRDDGQMGPVQQRRAFAVFTQDRAMLGVGGSPGRVLLDDPRDEISSFLIGDFGLRLLRRGGRGL